MHTRARAHTCTPDCVFACVCVRERENESARQREKERETDREKAIERPKMRVCMHVLKRHVCVPVSISCDSLTFLLLVFLLLMAPNLTTYLHSSDLQKQLTVIISAPMFPLPPHLSSCHSLAQREKQ
mmetsp:Transcript_14500/g.21156  ORF Transcript_14500/g.21156 Transcript_14500/m.21156 type:complete len:127 (-) Transcript_14500:228-608(-)